MSGEPEDLWPIEPSKAVSEALADLSVPPEVFSAVVALTVRLCQDPWPTESNPLDHDEDWREILIPDGLGIAEYRIDRANHRGWLTRVVLFPR